MEHDPTSVKNEAPTGADALRVAQPGRTGEATTRNTPVAFLHSLQASIGNRAAAGWVQTKLKVGAPNDVYEQEADRVADQVMRMPEPKTEPVAPSALSSPAIQRKCTECEEEEKTVQRKCGSCEQDETPSVQMKAAPGSGSGVADLETRIAPLQGRGEPLAPEVRSYFEPRLGTDFSAVRVHRDTEAGQTARQLNALAFTTGQDIAFAPGQYTPDTASGKKLLAHELTHVVQQRGGVPSATTNSIRIDSHDSAAEREAQGVSQQATASPVISARPSVKLAAPVISRADPQVTNIGMNLGTAPRSGLQFFPTNVTDTRVGPVSVQGGLLSGGASRLHVIIAENETIRRLARQLLPFFLTATPFTPPGAAVPLPLPIITEDQLAQALLVYNQYYLQVPAMPKWRTGLNFPLPIEIDPLSGVATLHPLLISSLATAFSPAWAPLLDARSSTAPAAPAATLRTDVATFLTNVPDSLGRGIHLAARSLTNAVAELLFVREAFLQFGGASFEVALAFMDNLVNNEIAQLAAQRDGATILALIRTALAAPPAPPNPTQQASLTRANLMLGNVAAVAAAAPPTSARRRAEKVVTIDTVKLDGANHDPAVDVAVANAIYTQCNVRFAHGVNATATPVQTTGWLGGNTDLVGSPLCGSATAEERALFTGASRQFGLSGRIRAFFVASYSNIPNSVAYSKPAFCSTGAGTVLNGMAVIQNASGKGDLAHECVHIIRNSPQHLADPNLMGSSPVSIQLNDTQCTDINNKA